MEPNIYHFSPLYRAPHSLPLLSILSCLFASLSHHPFTALRLIFKISLLFLRRATDVLTHVQHTMIGDQENNREIGGESALSELKTPLYGMDVRMCVYVSVCVYVRVCCVCMSLHSYRLLHLFVH
jgi:hypothetical protein